ncbi:hypothetical protein ACFWHR_03530 [Leucobacter sp. NPDC058333]|uniref:hypothetical protein n=1 Tax=Leucobacter sp. NPDC058333 TaxID=3346450 RepID=UPI00365F87FA
MSAYAPPLGVDTVLTPPTPASQLEQTLWRVKNQSASGLGMIDTVVSMLVGFSPLDEWVYKPFVGDWRSMELAAEAWPKCGQAVELINTRVSTFGEFVTDDWDGEAAYEFGRCHEKLGQLLDGLPQQCEQAGLMDQQLANFARGILEFINEVISGIVSFGLDLLSLAAVPGVNAINAGKVLAIAIPIIIGWTIDVVDLFNEFLGFIDAVIAIHTGIAGLLGGVRSALSNLTAAASVGLAIYETVTSIKGGVDDIRTLTGSGNSATNVASAAGGSGSGRRG